MGARKRTNNRAASAAPAAGDSPPAANPPQAKALFRGATISTLSAIVSFFIVKNSGFFDKEKSPATPKPIPIDDVEQIGHAFADADGEAENNVAAADPNEREAANDAALESGAAFSVWLPAGKVASPEPTMSNVTCAPRKLEGSCGLPRTEGRCARFVLDNAVDEADAREVRSMVSWLVAEAWGGGSGPPSVVDLHQGSISYKDKFIELAALMEFKSIGFTQAQKDAYERVRSRTRQIVAGQFGIPADDLLHDFTFFSHINGSKTAQTVHDEYWHLHIDTEQYGTFEYTSLLYLSSEHEDFSGGEFLFLPKDDGSEEKPVAVEPRFNRLVAFTSDAENPHRVDKVRSGIRIALTAAFTCDREKAAAVGPAFPAKLPDSS